MSDCPICFEVMENNNNNIKTECGHEFHSNCFLTNVAYNGFSCPCCRKELARIPCFCENHEFEDEYDDEYDDDDDDDEDEEYDYDEEYPFVAPLDYMVHKLNQKFSNRDLLKFIHCQYKDDGDEDDDVSEFFSLYTKISREYMELNEEEKEKELMAMEDKNEEIKLIDDFETIINTRIY
jgi:hypothetical protein